MTLVTWRRCKNWRRGGRLCTPSHEERERVTGVENSVVDDESEKEIVSDLLKAAAHFASANDDDDALDQEFRPAGTSKKRKFKKQSTKAKPNRKSLTPNWMNPSERILMAVERLIIRGQYPDCGRFVETVLNPS
jgi:hypothetical protein